MGVFVWQVPGGRKIASFPETPRIIGRSREIYGIRQITANAPQRILGRNVCFFPDGQRLAAANDGTIKIWDLRPSQEALNFRDLRSRSIVPPRLSWGADGHLLVASGLASTQVTLVDADTNREVADWRGLDDMVDRLVVSGPGRRVFAVTRNGTGYFWN